MIGTAAGVLLVMLSLQGTAPRVVWNASDSVPLGLYRIERAPVRRGDLVLIRLPPDTAQLAHQRGYLPKSAYLIKTVLALAGDHVCRFGAHVRRPRLAPRHAWAPHAHMARLPPNCGR
jgi:type IV secretory pathway protease TraF